MSERVLAVQVSCHLLVIPVGVTAPFIAVYEAPLHSSNSGSEPLRLIEAMQPPLGSGAGLSGGADGGEDELLIIQPGVTLPGSKPRELQFRVYEPAAITGFGNELSGFGSSGSGSSPAASFHLLGVSTVPYADLLAAVGQKRQLELPLSNPVSPLQQQTLSKFRSRLSLTVRVASSFESAPERQFEKALALANGDRYAPLPKEVPPSEALHKQYLRLFLATRQLPQRDESEASVLLAALFEKDLRGGNMRLQAITPWTAAKDAGEQMRFPGCIEVEYFAGEAQCYQLSLYRLPLAEEGDTSRITPAAFQELREEDRVGSAEFLLDYAGLDSAYLREKREQAKADGSAGGESADSFGSLGGLGGDDETPALSMAPPPLPASVGCLYTTSSHPSVLHMDLHLGHDVSPTLDADLRAHAARVTVSVDRSKYPDLAQNDAVVIGEDAPQPHPRPFREPRPRKTSAAAAAPVPPPEEPTSEPDTPTSSNSNRSPLSFGDMPAEHSTDAAAVEAVNQEQLRLARQTLSAPSSSSTPAPAPGASADDVPDAADVDVTGVDEASPELAARLMAMMEEGQTFLLHQVDAPEPKRQKLFYKPAVELGADGETLPGVLYLCDCNRAPSTVDVSTLQGLDLSIVSDIFLGQQAPAFHRQGAAPINPDDDDTLSFSLVTAQAVSLNLEALSAKQRAAWLLAVMLTIQPGGAGGDEEEAPELPADAAADGAADGLAA